MSVHSEPPHHIMLCYLTRPRNWKPVCSQKKSNFIATTSQHHQQQHNSSVWTRRTGSRAITNVCIINITSCSFAILVLVFPPLCSDSSHTMWWRLGPLWRIHRPQNRCISISDPCLSKYYISADLRWYLKLLDVNDPCWCMWIWFGNWTCQKLTHGVFSVRSCELQL